MSALDSVLIAASIAAVLFWAALSTYVLVVQRRRAHARVVAAAVITELQSDEGRRLPDHERLAHARPLLETASRELVMRIAADRETPAGIARVLTVWLLDKWGLATLQTDAAGHRGGRDKWRRMTALRILFRMDPAASLDLL